MNKENKAGGSPNAGASPNKKSLSGSRSATWARSNLVTLGAAAALTIYSAGYAKTRAAAQRFAVEDEARRPATAASEISYPDEKRVEPALRPDAVDTMVSAVNAQAPSNASPATVAPVASAPDTVTPDSVATKPIVGDSAKAGVGAAALPATSVVAATVTPPATPPAATARDSAATTGQAGDSAAAKDKPAPRWKDGVFSGWGTSRHGDIEASVEIKDGRIVSAWISQCYTRYPCSRIAILPPQVAARQSADVDFVSRATQSTNAFYYGVLEALAKAK